MRDLYVFKSSPESLHQNWVLLITAEDFPDVLRRIKEQVNKISQSGEEYFALKDMRIYLRERDAPITNVPYDNCLFLWKVLETTGDVLALTGMDRY